MRKSGKAREKGQAFTLVIVFMGFLMIYIGFTSLHLLTETKPIQEKDLASVQAQYSAEAGLEVNRKTTSGPPPPVASPVIVYALDWQTGNFAQAGQATVQVAGWVGVNPVDVTVRSTGTSQDITGTFRYLYGATDATGIRGTARVEAQLRYTIPWTYSQSLYWNVNMSPNWVYQSYP
ncbi:MAG: hypothetical protein HYU64_16595 [Armatimonadetes bacterium]|nr:hypothetical protein [Armatimonadota bacterium]